MHRLWQTVCERVGFSRAGTYRHDESHTVRTEVMVEREEMTVRLGGGVTSATLDTCPVCGHKLVVERARLNDGPR
jgi:C4-type Zn-finger protein